MTATHSDPIYAMGYSDEERQRLSDQAALYDASTRQLLVDAGLGAGARVLDVGCGVGDVSLLAASIVGPGGTVVGVDTDVRSLAVAEARARSRGLGQITLREGDFRRLKFSEPFDAVVGRFVLMYVADPADAVGRLALHVRPGGILAFQEFHLEGAMRSWPLGSSPLYERSVEWVLETFRRAGVDTEMGLKLSRTFKAAGLPPPNASLYCPLMSAPGHPGYHLFADILRSTLPLMESFGVATAEAVDVETYAGRLVEEIAANDAMAGCAPAVGAWTTRPLTDGGAGSGSTGARAVFVYPRRDWLVNLANFADGRTGCGGSPSESTDVITAAGLTTPGDSGPSACASPVAARAHADARVAP